MRHHLIFTDGAFFPGQRPTSGWAWIAVADTGNRRFEVAKAAGMVTHLVSSFEVELYAIRQALATPWAVGAHIWTDCQAAERLAHRMPANLPSTTERLAREVLRETVFTGGTIRWVRGHDGTMWNEAADYLARFMGKPPLRAP